MSRWLREISEFSQKQGIGEEELGSYWAKFDLVALLIADRTQMRREAIFNKTWETVFGEEAPERAEAVMWKVNSAYKYLHDYGAAGIHSFKMLERMYYNVLFMKCLAQYEQTHDLEALTYQIPKSKIKTCRFNFYLNKKASPFELQEIYRPHKDVIERVFLKLNAELSKRKKANERRQARKLREGAEVVSLGSTQQEKVEVPPRSEFPNKALATTKEEVTPLTKAQILLKQVTLLLQEAGKTADAVNSQHENSASRKLDQMELHIQRLEQEAKRLKERIQEQNAFIKELRQYGLKQAEQKIFNHIRTLNAPEYGHLLSLLFLTAQETSKPNPDCLAGFAQNFVIALEACGIEPFWVDKIGQDIEIERSKIGLQYNLDFDLDKNSCQYGRVRFPGWRYNGTNVVLPMITQN